MKYEFEISNYNSLFLDQKFLFPFSVLLAARKYGFTFIAAPQGASYRNILLIHSDSLKEVTWKVLRLSYEFGLRLSLTSIGNIDDMMDFVALKENMLDEVLQGLSREYQGVEMQNARLEQTSLAPC